MGGGDGLRGRRAGRPGRAGRRRPQRAGLPARSSWAAASSARRTPASRAGTSGTRSTRAQVLPTVDVTAGVRLALDVLGADQSPMVLPLPAYSPQLGLAEVTDREQWDLPVDPGRRRATCSTSTTSTGSSPTAPGPCCSPTRTTRAATCTPAPSSRGSATLRPKHGARVISDEIHAPLVLPGAEHLPYLASTAPPSTRSPWWPPPRRSTPRASSAPRSSPPPGRPWTGWRACPMARNDSWSPLGVVAAVAAYRDGDAWLAALVQRLTELRTLLADLLAEHLPEARMRPLEATYLAWLDLRAYGHDDPAAVAAKGGVRLAAGHDYQPGLSRARAAQPRHVAGAADRDRPADGRGPGGLSVTTRASPSRCRPPGGPPAACAPRRTGAAPGWRARSAPC